MSRPAPEAEILMIVDGPRLHLHHDELDLFANWLDDFRSELAAAEGILQCHCKVLRICDLMI
jgi:hypothetical protein